MKKHVLSRYLISVGTSMLLLGLPITGSAKTDISSKPDKVISASRYSDIAGHWAEKSLVNAVENGFISGMTNTTVAPDSLITRAEMSAMLVRIFEPITSESISNFRDVRQFDWYYSSLQRAVAMGIISGDGTNMYPNAPITRQEACALLSRAFSIQDRLDLSGRYTDANSIASWAYDSVSACASMGALRSVNGAINPNEAITRAEFASMIYSIVQSFDSSIVDSIQGRDCNSAIITAPSGVYEDILFNGNLYLADGLGNTAINLDSSYVSSDVIIRGGNRLDLENNSAVNRIIFDGCDNDFIIVTDGSSSVNEVIVDRCTGDITLRGNIAKVIIKSSDSKVYIKDAYIENLSIIDGVVPDVIIDDNSIVESFVEDRGIKNSSKKKYIQFPTYYSDNSFGVVDDIMVSIHNPVKLLDSYHIRNTDFVSDLEMEIDERNDKIIFYGTLYEEEFGKKDQYEGMYIPLRLWIRDIADDFDVYLDGARVRMDSSDYDENDLRLNMLIPFSEDYRTSELEFVPIYGNRYDSVKISLELDDSVKFR